MSPRFELLLFLLLLLSASLSLFSALKLSDIKPRVESLFSRVESLESHLERLKSEEESDDELSQEDALELAASYRKMTRSDLEKLRESPGLMPGARALIVAEIGRKHSESIQESQEGLDWEQADES